MTATERAKRSDALYYETVSVNRRVLCDMVANRESDLEDAKAENEHMRIKAIAVVGELQEENERLKAENAKLREEFNKMDVWHSKELTAAMAENAKLRELVRDMYGFIQCMDEDCGDVTFSDCFDYCKHDTADDGCCKTGECWYERRMRDLGVEVDA